MSAILRVARVEAHLVSHRWKWAEENAAAVAANWTRRRQAAPAIFNGRVLMVARTALAGEVMEAEFFATDYANLLAWSDGSTPDGTVANGFAMGALLSSDGGYLLGEMGNHTANAGRLYFPCGTPDLDDVARDGRVDLLSSLVREIEEETGLPASELAIDPEWIVVRDGGLVAFMRVVRLDMEAEEARSRILRHLAADPEPELSDIRIARGPADIDAARMPGTVPIFLRDAFASNSQYQG